MYVSLVILHIKYTRRRENDFKVHFYSCRLELCGCTPPSRNPRRQISPWRGPGEKRPAQPGGSRGWSDSSWEGTHNTPCRLYGSVGRSGTPISLSRQGGPSAASKRCRFRPAGPGGPRPPHQPAFVQSVQRLLASLSGKQGKQGDH